MAKKTTRTTKTNSPTIAKATMTKGVKATTRRRKTSTSVDSWSSKQPSFSQIQTAAYLRWLATGDHHVDCWLVAERELSLTGKGGKSNKSNKSSRSTRHGKR